MSAATSHRLPLVFFSHGRPWLRVPAPPRSLLPPEADACTHVYITADTALIGLLAIPVLVAFIATGAAACGIGALLSFAAIGACADFGRVEVSE